MIAHKKDTRTTKPCTNYLISECISYDSLSQFQAFITNLSRVDVPNNINEVLKIFEWGDVNHEEIWALEKIGMETLDPTKRKKI